MPKRFIAPFIQRVRRTLQSETHSGRRWRAIGLSIATSMSDRVINGVCSLIQVPLALNFLGQETFGLWITLTSLVTAMYIADFGLGVGIQNNTAEAYGKDDYREAEKVSATGIIMLATIGLTLFTLCTPFCFLIDWGNIFHVQNPATHQQTGAALAIIISAFCLGLPFTAANRITGAFQLIWMSNIKGSLTSITTILLIALAVKLKLSLLPFLAVVVAPPVIANLVLLVVIYRRFKWSFNFLATFDGTLAHRLFQNNWLFILPNIGGIIMSLSPAMLISSSFGATALTPFNLIQRLLGLSTQAQAMMIAPFWPAYTEAVSRGDFGWARVTYRKSLVISFVFAVLPTLTFAWWGRWILHLWSKQPPDSFGMPLIITLSIWTAISNFSQPPAILLNSLGKIRGQASYGLISVLGSLALMPKLISRFGPAGAPLALIIVFGSVALPLVLWESGYQLRRLRAEPQAAVTP